MPTVASFGDIRLHANKQVMVVGRYDVEGKGARVSFDDGHAVELGTRPDDERRFLKGKMVVAKGELVASGDGSSARLEAVQSVSKADG